MNKNQLTRHHHNLKEEINVYTNRLQKCIDVVFLEFNSLFKCKYGIVYMNILETFGSADNITNTDIRTIRKCFDIKGKGNRCAQGHCVRKLLRIIYHLLTANQQFDPKLLR